jgi:hypothetical protein
VPLGTRTTIATLALVSSTLLSIATQVVALAFVGAPKSVDAVGRPALDTRVLVLGVVGLASFFALLACWISVPMWIYRAATNLRGLGRYGMRFSAASCIWWFFVPFAAIVMVPQAISELWRASDPALDQGSWSASPRTALIGLWWGPYLAAGFFGLFALLPSLLPGTKDPVLSASMQLVSALLRGMSAVFLVLIMRGVLARQAQAAQRLGMSA